MVWELTLKDVLIDDKEVQHFGSICLFLPQINHVVCLLNCRRGDYGRPIHAIAQFLSSALEVEGLSQSS